MTRLIVLFAVAASLSGCASSPFVSIASRMSDTSSTARTGFLSFDVRTKEFKSMAGIGL